MVVCPLFSRKTPCFNWATWRSFKEPCKIGVEFGSQLLAQAFRLQAQLHRRAAGDQLSRLTAHTPESPKGWSRRCDDSRGSRSECGWWAQRDFFTRNQICMILAKIYVDMCLPKWACLLEGAMVLFLHSFFFGGGGGDFQGKPQEPQPFGLVWMPHGIPFRKKVSTSAPHSTGFDP